MNFVIIFLSILYLQVVNDLKANAISNNVYQYDGTYIINELVDLSDRGKKDIVLVYSRYQHFQTKLFLQIWRQAESGVTPVLIEPFDDITVFDIVDMNNDGIKDLIYLQQDVLYYRTISLQDKKYYLNSPIQLQSIRSLFSYGLDATTLFYNFCDDFDSDGKLDLMFPNEKGILFISDFRSEYPKEVSLPVTTVGRIGGLQQRNLDILKIKRVFYNLEVPEFVFKDYDGNGLRDLIFISGKVINIFLNTNNTINLTPIVLTFNLKNKRIDGVVPNFKSLISFDNDNYLDIIIKRQDVSTNLLKSSTDVLFFSGKATNHIYYQADYSIVEKGLLAMFPPFLKDMNNDGYKDYIDINFEISLGKAISAFISRVAIGNIKFYHFNGQEFMADRKNVKVKVGMKLEPPFIMSIFSINGDFTGDGHNDLFVGMLDKEQILIYSGNSSGGFDKKAKTYKSKIFTDLTIVDMDGNGKDDIVTFDPTGNNFSIYYF